MPNMPKSRAIVEAARTAAPSPSQMPTAPAGETDPFGTQFPQPTPELEAAWGARLTTALAQMDFPKSEHNLTHKVLRWYRSSLSHANLPSWSTLPPSVRDEIVKRTVAKLSDPVCRAQMVGFLLRCMRQWSLDSFLKAVFAQAAYAAHAEVAGAS